MGGRSKLGTLPSKRSFYAKDNANGQLIGHHSLRICSVAAVRVSLPRPPNCKPSESCSGGRFEARRLRHPAHPKAKD